MTSGFELPIPIDGVRWTTNPLELSIIFGSGTLLNGVDDHAFQFVGRDERHPADLSPRGWDTHFAARSLELGDSDGTIDVT
jgi:hypothetical protein